MSNIPSLSYSKIIKALERLGFYVVSQKGSHIKLRKIENNRVRTLIVPAHKPVKVNTLRLIIKQSGLSVEEFKSKL